MALVGGVTLGGTTTQEWSACVLGILAKIRMFRPLVQGVLPLTRSVQNSKQQVKNREHPWGA